MCTNGQLSDTDGVFAPYSYRVTAPALDPTRAGDRSQGTELLRANTEFPPRLVFDRLWDFLRSEIHAVILLTQKIPQSIKSLTDLTQQLMKHSGLLFLLKKLVVKIVVFRRISTID